MKQAKIRLIFFTHHNNSELVKGNEDATAKFLGYFAQVACNDREGILVVRWEIVVKYFELYL